uniref:Uncharacterized protein n=1 Tax=Ailuropoda melanoleuca TaxID=9646 RepID=A0A7N5JEP0_AILME
MASPRKGIVLKEAQHWNLQHTSIGISDCLHHEPSYGYNTIHSPHRALLDLPADLSSTTHLLLVTGDKKGLSFVLHLCQQFSGDMRGHFYLLDINTEQLRHIRLSKEYGGLDVLVNNASVAFKTADRTPFHIQAEVTMKTNFFGTRAVCTELLPLMTPQGEPHQGPKLWCFWHDLPLPLCPIYRRPLSLLSHTGLIAVSPPGQVPLCLRTLTHSSCSQQRPLTCWSFTTASLFPSSLHSNLSSERPFTDSMPLTGEFS